MVRSLPLVLLGGLVGLFAADVAPVPDIVPGTPECVSNNVANGGHCPNFTAGAICDGVDINMPALDMLRGKHLIIQDMEWMPYAAPDPDGTHHAGWKGLNIELFDYFASVLGFTYNMSNMGYAGDYGPAETWTQQLYRAVDDADLTGCYWIETNDRMNHGVSYLRGTYDLTPVLIARMLSAGETKAETWYKSFYNFLDPFTFNLWWIILGFVVCSGVVDWLVERKTVKEARVTASIYEYFAGLCGRARFESAAGPSCPCLALADRLMRASPVCAQPLGWLRVPALKDECHLPSCGRLHRARPHLILHC